MLLNYKKQLFYCLKTNYFKYFSSLLVILIGVFLLPKIAYLSSITPEKIIELTNQERQKAGLSELTANQLLTQAAYEKGKAIIEAGEFSHNIDEQKFSAWIKDTGYKYSYVGENLAIDFVTSEGIISAWLNSDAHKKNLLNSYYEEIGLAVIENNFNGQNTILVVQIFGVPPKGIVQPIISGINNQNYLIGQNYLPNLMQNPRAENLLTHSISQNLNNELILPMSYYQTYSLENNNLNKVSNFFEQYNLLSVVNHISITFSILLLLSMFYIYFFCFSRLNKIA